MTRNSYTVPPLSRRGLLRAGTGLLGVTALGRGVALADQPALGTWPEGAAGSTVFIGITCRAPAPMRCRARTS